MLWQTLKYIPVCCGILSTAACTTTLEGTIRQLGYVPVSLQSTEYRPGKVVATESKNPLEVRTVCDSKSYIGPTQPVKEDGATIKAQQRLLGTFALGGEYLKKIKGNASYKYVKSVSVVLTNVTVEEIPSNQVYGGLHAQTADCSQGIRDERKRSDIGFLQKALRADGTYTVDMDEKITLDVQAQQSLLKNVAVTLGASPDSIKNNTIGGANLYWGVLHPVKDLVLIKDEILEERQVGADCKILEHESFSCPPEHDVHVRHEERVGLSHTWTRTVTQVAGKGKPKDEDWRIIPGSGEFFVATIHTRLCNEHAKTEQDCYTATPSHVVRVLDGNKRIAFDVSCRSANTYSCQLEGYGTWKEVRFLTR